MKILIISLLVSSTSYADTSYQQKFCTDIPYLVFIRKAVDTVKSKQNFLVDQKYSSTSNDDLNDQELENKMQEKMSLRNILTHEVCHKKSIRDELVSSAREKLKDLIKVKSLCLKAKSKDHKGRIYGLVDGFEDTASANSSWKEQYFAHLKSSCETVQSSTKIDNSKYCSNAKSIDFKYTNNLNKETDDIKFCKKMVNDANVYLKKLGEVGSEVKQYDKKFSEKQLFDCEMGVDIEKNCPAPDAKVAKTRNKSKKTIKQLDPCKSGNIRACHEKHTRKANAKPSGGSVSY
jgi:hypothetical protein